MPFQRMQKCYIEAKAMGVEISSHSCETLQTLTEIKLVETVSAKLLFSETQDHDF